MTLDERIAKLRAELAQLVAQETELAARHRAAVDNRLRCEGAIVVLQHMAAEEKGAEKGAPAVASGA